MPLIPEKKSFRDKLNQGSLTSIAKGGEMDEPDVSPSTVPGAIMDKVQQDQSPPEQSTSPTPDAKDPNADPSKPDPSVVDPTDTQVADYLGNTQTLNGPNVGSSDPDSTPTPVSFANFYRKWKAVPTELNPADKKIFQDKLSQLDQKMLDAEQTYKDQKNRVAWSEAAEQLGHAMVQLMAAQDASKNDWSVGGIKFDKNNWEGKFDRALKEYDSHKDTITKQHAVVAREFDKADNRVERAGKDEKNMLERDFFTTQARIEANAKRSAREDEANLKDQSSKERAAKEKARMYIANYEAADDAVNKLSNGDFKDDKEKEKLKNEVTDSLRKNGHIGVSKDLADGGVASVGKSGGILGFFQSDDYSKMKSYINANKINGVKSVYRGYGVPVPNDINSALGGDSQGGPSDQSGQQKQITSPVSNEVERTDSSGKTAIFDKNTKQFLRFK